MQNLTQQAKSKVSSGYNYLYGKFFGGNSNTNEDNSKTNQNNKEN